MAGQVLKTRRLVNPGKRRRMTPKQIKYFGTKRQKAALRNRSIRPPKSFFGSSRKIRRARLRHGPSSAKSRYYRKQHETRSSAYQKRNQSGFVSRAEHAAEDAIRSVEHAAEEAIGSVTHAVNRGRRNVGAILTVVPANPGRRRKKSMAATKRRRKNRTRNRARAHHRRRNAGHRNYGHHRHRNRNPKVIVRYRNRRHNRMHNRRRNQGIGGFLSGDAGAVVGVLGGAAVTKIIMGFFPSNLSSGWPGYITTGIVAVVTGQVTGRMMKNQKLGNWMTVGGLVMVGLQIASDFFPQLQLPFTVSHSGTAGMGLLTSSNFYVPQVNLPGSMATFVTPAGIPAPVVVPATALKGFGATGTSAMNSGIRRVGRLR